MLAELLASVLPIGVTGAMLLLIAYHGHEALSIAQRAGTYVRASAIVLGLLGLAIATGVLEVGVNPEIIRGPVHILVSGAKVTLESLLSAV